MSEVQDEEGWLIREPTELEVETHLKFMAEKGITSLQAAQGLGFKNDKGFKKHLRVVKKPRVTEQLAERYIELVAEGYQPTDAAKAMGLSRNAFNAFIGPKPELKAKFDQAMYDGAAPLIEEAERRGSKGWLEPIVQQGRHVIGVDGEPMFLQKFDSNLLMFTIKGRRPEYKDNPKVELQQAIAMKVEDRTQEIGAMWRILEEIGATKNDQRAAVEDVPIVGELLAESESLQPSTGSVPES